MVRLLSSRSTCFTPCLLNVPRAWANPCPMAWTAKEGTGEDSERTVGQRQDPLGVKIPIVQLVDEGNQMVFAKYGSGFHYALSEAKEDILLPISCPCKFEAKLGRKDRAKYATDSTHLGGKMRTRSQQSRLSSCRLGSNQIFSSGFL